MNQLIIAIGLFLSLSILSPAEAFYVSYCQRLPANCNGAICEDTNPDNSNPQPTESIELDSLDYAGILFDCSCEFLENRAVDFREGVINPTRREIYNFFRASYCFTDVY